MKILSTFFYIYFFAISVEGQVDSLYQSLVAEAGLFHLQKDCERSIVLFEKAFRLKRPDALTAYKAAGVYSLERNVDKAFFYLKLALKSGWTEAGRLSIDPYFDYLRASKPDRWKNVEAEAFLREAEYEKSLKFPALRKRINLMALNDQHLRYKRVQAKNENEIALINKEISKADSTNLSYVKSIVKDYGWPKVSEIGVDGQNNFWLMVQHADQDVLFQKRSLTEMEKLKKTNEINFEHYAFLHDRVQCNLNFKQLYGTQVNWTNNGKASGFRPIVQEDSVDRRRISLGLLPLSIYALTYGFKYTKVTALQSNKRDSTDLAYAKQLIDSANHCFTNGEFEKTYDYYNRASTVSGGMSNVDMYNAAIVFAIISSKVVEQRYKDIALDFLNLLYLRQELTKNRLEAQHEFAILYNEQRWAAIYHALK